MKQFCENPYCEHPGAKGVPVSVETPSDQKRTLCTSYEEAYSWDVQHGTKVARAETATLHARVDLRVNRRELATILAALRFHQDENLQGTPEIPDVAIKEIATDGGTLKPLSFEEVEALSQRLSLGQHETHDTYSRSWKCPNCGRSITCSYEDLAEAGIPICAECDRPMELQ